MNYRVACTRLKRRKEQRGKSKKKGKKKGKKFGLKYLSGWKKNCPEITHKKMKGESVNRILEESDDKKRMTGEKTDVAIRRTNIKDTLHIYHSNKGHMFYSVLFVI